MLRPTVSEGGISLWLRLLAAEIEPSARSICVLSTALVVDLLGISERARLPFIRLSFGRGNAKRIVDALQDGIAPVTGRSLDYFSILGSERVLVAPVRVLI